MASYNELNALIDAYINRNGVQAITGQILNGVLKAMVEQLGRGYTIMGAATPTIDPGTPDGPECYFASTPGTYTDFNGLQVVPGELALLCYTPTDGWTKATIYEGFRQVGATIDGNVGTPSVGVSYANGVLSFDFHNMKGNTGDPAGFGTIGATVDGNIGTPGVTVSESGPNTAKNLTFAFTNLKGETGVTSVVATVDNTTGTPSCAVSLVGQELHLDFHGLKGAQGDTGVSADFPITIANNLTTDDPAAALSAAQGVVLDGKVSQLEAEVDELDIDVNGGNVDVDITPTFTDDKYCTWSGTTITRVTNTQLALITILPVSAGETYRIKLTQTIAPQFFSNYFIFAKTDSESSIDSSDVGDYVTKLDAVNHIYRFTIPAGTTKVFSATLKTDKSDVWVKREEVRDGIADKVEDLDLQINGADEEVDITPTFTDNYYCAWSGTTITKTSNPEVALITISPVSAGEKYHLKLTQTIAPRFFPNYFVFAKTDSKSSINSSEVGDYVAEIDQANHIYEFTIPENTTKVFSATLKTDKSSVWVKKEVHGGLANDVSALKDSVADLEEAIPELEGSIEGLSANDKFHLWDSIKKPIVFSGKTLVALGDSITYGIASPGLITITDCYIKLFCDYAGVGTLVNRAVSATTIIQRGGGNDIYDQLISYTGTADVFIIAGGTNDWNQGRAVGTFGDSTPSASVYGGMDAICTYLQTNFPDAEVIFITPIPYTKPASDFPSHIADLNAYRKAIYDVATYYGYSVVNGNGLGMPKELGGWNNTMVADSDGCHPTARGHELYARSLAGKLL